MKDVQWCGDLGEVGAHCANTLTNETRDIPKTVWDSERVGWLCTNSDGFNDTEKAIDQLCNETNLCDYETRQAISAALFRLEKVVARAQRAKRNMKKGG